MARWKIPKAIPLPFKPDPYPLIPFALCGFFIQQVFNAVVNLAELHIVLCNFLLYQPELFFNIGLL